MTTEGERTRTRMVRGAAELLRERGYSGTGFREVIERTGAPRGSIYHHFPGGKAELATEAVDDVGALARQVIDSSLADGDPIGALRAFVELWRADFERSGYRAGCPIVAVAVESHDEAPELLDSAARAFERWQDAFAGSLRRAGVPTARAKRLAALVARRWRGRSCSAAPAVIRSRCSTLRRSSRRHWPRRWRKRRARGSELPVGQGKRYGHGMTQEVRFCTSADGIRIAYAVHGKGPPLVRVATWLTDLHFDWESPIWRHWLESLGERHTVVRYDERGCGLSGRDVGDPSVETWVGDLEAVVDAAGLDRFALLGISQGAAVAVSYAAAHPERVTDVVLYGGFARGRRIRGQRLEEDVLIPAIRAGWERDDPTFRRLFSMMFLPGGTPEQMAWYEDLLRASTTADNAVELFEARGTLDVSDLAPEVGRRTLVVHARDDRVVPADEGRLLAALIPDARLILLESSNHILLADEPAWTYFVSELDAFMGTQPSPGRLAADPEPERARARGAGARCRRPVERGDRRAALDQRPNRRATPLQRLREARRFGKGRARRGRRRLLAAVPVALDPAIGARGCV